MEIFNKLSWGDYLTWVGILLACYYIGVALLCYRTEITNLVLGARNHYPADTETVPEPFGEEISDLSVRVIDQINSILQHAGKEANKATLVSELRQVLAGYPGLRVPAYRDAVYDYINREAKEICGVGISAQELED